MSNQFGGKVGTSTVCRLQKRFLQVVVSTQPAKVANAYCTCKTLQGGPGEMRLFSFWSSGLPIRVGASIFLLGH